MEPVPNGAFQSRDSCPLAKGTATNTISSGFLCSNCSSEARKGHPQTSYQADFSVRIAHRNPKGTATNTIPNRFLCSNGLSGTGSMVRLAELASTTKLSAVFGIPTYALRHARYRGTGIIYSETVRTGTQTRYAPYAVLGSDVRAFRLCANASEP